jgi:hypothetical protein
MRAKSETFKDEQDQIKKKLINMLPLKDADFNPEVKTITLYELDQEDMKNSLIALIPEIRKYFAVTNKAFFYPEESKRLHMTVLRELLKNDYKIQSTFVWEGGIKTRRYHFYPVKK